MTMARRQVTGLARRQVTGLARCRVTGLARCQVTGLVRNQACQKLPAVSRVIRAARTRVQMPRRLRAAIQVGLVRSPVRNSLVQTRVKIPARAQRAPRVVTLAVHQTVRQVLLMVPLRVELLRVVAGLCRAPVRRSCPLGC